MKKYLIITLIAVALFISAYLSFFSDSSYVADISVDDISIAYENDAATEPIIIDPSAQAKGEICEQVGGLWRVVHDECEFDTSDLPIEEFPIFCSDVFEGSYNDCAAEYGCRHDDTGEQCTGIEKCFHVCSF